MRKLTYIFTAIIYITMANIATAVVPEFKAPKVPDFSRYQTILNRMPFGAPPPDPGTTISPEDAKTAAQVAREQQQLARKLNMSCVNITPSGKPAVGFTDLSQKPAVNFYLLVGASAGGWTLKSANYEEEWAELEKDGTTIFVKLGQGLMAEPPKTASSANKTEEVNPEMIQRVRNEFAEEQMDKKQPVLKTLTEQMISIATPSAPGAIVPPLPNIKIDENDLLKAMETKNELYEEDSDRVLLSKANVEEKKEKLAEHILDEGGNVNSYLHRLRKRQLEERLKQKQEQLEQQQHMTTVAKQAAEEAIKNTEIMMLEEALRENQALEDTQN